MGNILEALKYINVASLSYQEWVNVGMALKAEGYDVSVWDEWSRNDSRYKAGECELLPEAVLILCWAMIL